MPDAAHNRSAQTWRELKQGAIFVNGELFSSTQSGHSYHKKQLIRIARVVDNNSRQVGRPIKHHTQEERQKAHVNSQQAYRERKKRAAHFRTQFTGEQEWYTPAVYLDAVKAVLGTIDLDPASSLKAQEAVQAARFFTAEDDGLFQAWQGRIWLNPPYTQPLIWQFVRRLVSEVDAGHVSEALLLTHNYSDTSWFQHAQAHAQRLCFTKGRIRFVDPDGRPAAPTQGQVFFYFGHNADRFTAVFGEVGFIR